jgi:paraquat-inducible protein B
VKIDWSRDPPELPVAPGEIADLEAKLGSILTKIDQMPITTIGERAATVLKSLNETLSNASVVLKDVDNDAVPRVRKALDDLDRVLQNTNATFVDRDAPGQQAVREALQEVASAARSLRALTDYLERHPEALIRGKAGEPK